MDSSYWSDGLWIPLIDPMVYGFLLSISDTLLGVNRVTAPASQKNNLNVPEVTVIIKMLRK